MGDLLSSGSFARVDTRALGGRAKPGHDKGGRLVAIVLLEVLFQIGERAKAVVFVFCDPAIGDFLDRYRI
jgi:hypothetical protein